jgi:repressor LexA
MNNNNLDNREFKGLFFINDNIVYKGKSPSLRAIAEHLGFKSPRSASILLENLEEKGYIKKTPGGNIVILKGLDGKAHSDRTIELPLLGNIACGIPLLAEENIEAMIPISQKIAKPGADYFILRAEGESMNKVIKNGDLVVVRQQPVAENGQIVVALIDDKATLKEFQKTKDHIILKPKSTKKEFKDIIMSNDFFVQGVVVSIISN